MNSAEKKTPWWLGLEILTDPVCILDDDQNVIYANQSFMIFFELNRSLIRSKNNRLWNLIKQPDNLQVNFADADAWTDFYVESEIYIKESTRIPMQLFFMRFVEETSQKKHFMFFLKDISLEIKLNSKYRGQLDQNEKLLKELRQKVTEAEYLKALGNFDTFRIELNVLLNKAGDLGKTTFGWEHFSIIMNVRGHDIFNRLRESRLGGVIRSRLGLLEHQLMEYPESTLIINQEVVLMHLNPRFGDRFWVLIQLSANKVIDKNFLEAVYSQISRMADNQILLSVSTTDALTNVYNRRFFEAQLELELKQFSLNSSPMSLILLDVDFFKKINDTYGHPVGDLVLVKIAQLLKQSFRDSDICARIGGEEFAIVMPNTTYADAIRVADRFRILVSELNIPIIQEGVSKEIKFTISCGVTAATEVNKHIDDIYKLCDKALYEAKAAGRNNVKGINF